MPQDSTQAEQPPEQSRETAWQRRRRLAAVFGDVLPETTSDERSAETAVERADESASDAWLRAQVPPHHG